VTRFKINKSSIAFIKIKLRNAFDRKVKDQAISNAGTLVFIVGAGLIALHLQTRTQILPKAKAAVPEFTMDEAIPEGFELHTIDVVDYEALDSILGKYSIVDLHTVSESPNVKPRKVASRVKLVKVSGSTNNFAILIPRAQVSDFMSTPGPYRVAIQKPDPGPGTEFVKKTVKPKKRVVYISE